jgi:hypothetical protein
VTEQIGNQYLGTLNNVPFSIEPNEGTYLVLGAEIPFGPEHIINIQGAGFYWWSIRKALKQPPTRRWPRE